jgi:hypothetical protein
VVVAEHEYMRFEADEGGARREVPERRQRVVVARTASSRDLARGYRDMFATREVVIAEPVGRFRYLDDRLEWRDLLPRVVHARVECENWCDQPELHRLGSLMALSEMMFFCWAGFRVPTGATDVGHAGWSAPIL